MSKRKSKINVFIDHWITVRISNEQNEQLYVGRHRRYIIIYAVKPFTIGIH